MIELVTEKDFFSIFHKRRVHAKIKNDRYYLRSEWRWKRVNKEKMDLISIADAYSWGFLRLKEDDEKKLMLLIDSKRRSVKRYCISRT